MLKINVIITAMAITFGVSGGALAFQDHQHQEHKHHSKSHEHAEVEFTRAEVVEVDTERHELVLSHDTIEHLNMPAMTMGFSVVESIDINKLQEGDEIQVKVERFDQNFVITAIETETHGH